MSTNGLGRGLGSLLEPKASPAAKGTAVRGIGVLMGGSPNRVGIGLDPQPNGSSPATAVERRETLGQIPALDPTKPSSPLSLPQSVRWALVAADLFLLGVAGWILLMPAYSDHRLRLGVGTLLVGTAAGLGTLAVVAGRR